MVTAEDSDHLGCYAVSLGEWFAEVSKEVGAFIFKGQPIYKVENNGTTYLRKFWNYSPNDSV
jgi:hypothetical protein